jgi:hypothetical protein
LPYPNTYYPPPDNTGTTSGETTESEEESRPKFVPAVWPSVNYSSENQKLDKMATNMPTRNHHSAPKFDGDPESLDVFLGDVEQLAIECELTPKQQIEWTIRYAPVAEQALWKLQPSVATENWSTFKDDLHELYPGASGDRKFSVANLEGLTDKQATLPMENSAQFGEYYRAFAKISAFLKSKGRITEREISNTFLKGMEYSFRVKVRNQLRAENPTHHTDDPWAIKEITKVALFVLSCSGDEFQNPGSAEGNSNQVRVKKEFDITKLEFQKPYGELDLSLLAHEVVKQMNLQLGDKGNPELNTYRPTVRDTNCVFCSETTHFQRDCPKAAEYVNKGLCKRNSEGFITLNNGGRISRRTAPGRNLKDKIDNWHKVNGQSSNIASTNFFEVSEAKSQFVWVEEEPDRETKDITQRDVEELQTLENLVASTQKRINDKKGRMDVDKNRPVTRSVSREQASQKQPTQDKEQAQINKPSGQMH